MTALRGLAAAFSGAAEGMGAGLVAEAKSAREEMMERLRQAHQSEEAEKSRQLTRDEGKAGRDLTMSENAENRRIAQEEGDKTRGNALAIQKQNQEFLEKLPSNNPTEIHPATGEHSTRTTRGLMPKLDEKGERIKEPMMKVGDSGKLYPADATEGDGGESLSPTMFKSEALKQANDRLSLKKTELTIAGRADVAAKGNETKLSLEQIRQGGATLRSTARDDVLVHVAGLRSEDGKVKAESAAKLKQMGIDADVAMEAAKALNAQDLARLNNDAAQKRVETLAGNKGPSAGQVALQKLDAAEQQEFRRQGKSAGEKAAALSEKWVGGTPRIDFDAIGGREQFIKDYADAYAEDAAAKQAGQIKLVRTPEEITKAVIDARKKGGGGDAPPPAADEEKPRRNLYPEAPPAAGLSDGPPTEAPASPAPKPAAGGDVPRPDEMTDAQIIAAGKASLAQAAGRPDAAAVRAKIEARMRAWGVDPSALGK